MLNWRNMPYAHTFATLAGHLETVVSHGGYVFLFLVTILEGIPVVGMAVPGHAAIIIAGFLAKIGLLDIWLVIVISVTGAVIGDYMGFALGRKYGLSFIDKVRPYFFVTDKHIEKTRALLSKHTGKAMIIGRFTLATRSLMPFLVGASQTSAGRFWFFNIIGGVSWAVISIMAGYLFGAGYHVAAVYFGRLAVMAVLAAVVIVWGYRFVNDHYHIFRKYELFIVILDIVALWILSETIQDAWAAHSFMANFDIWVNQNLAFRPVISAVFISSILGTAATSLSGVFVGLWFLVKKKWRSAVIMLSSIALTAVSIGVMKEFFLRARPENALQSLTDPSFPSGHSAMAAAFFLCLLYLVAPRIHSWIKREIVMALCVLAVLSVGLSRLVLNVHWATDVIAGWTLGVFISSSIILSVRYVGNLFVRKNIY